MQKSVDNQSPVGAKQTQIVAKWPLACLPVHKHSALLQLPKLSKGLGQRLVGGGKVELTHEELAVRSSAAC